ncbi:MAG: glycosyltransferase family 2 protein [Cyclobacteriaceae bacterium]|nr:glycosyltransferase family 2 protein [Cyclobacteriaceae bacterium]
MNANAEVKLISVVSPVYGASMILDELVVRLRNALGELNMSYEIILVEDASPDGSWEKVKENCKKFAEVKGVKLSRNFGQHSAITAGLAVAKGDWVIVMDCDLQDDPVYIPLLVNKAKEGFDIVYTLKTIRKHGFLKNMMTRFFNWVFNFLIETKSLKAHGMVGAYSLITRKVVNEFLRYGDYRRHYLMVLRWLGFSHAFVSIEHKERYAGHSSYTLSKLISHAVDGITSQSDKVLLLTVYSGFFMALASMLAGVSIVILYFIHGFQSGWASLAVLILFSSGIIITTIGIVGVYVGKTFEQAKGRQLFIIDKTINL